MTPQLKKRLVNVEEYHLMSQAGILKEDDRVELIAGEIITMSPIGSRHAACFNRLLDILITFLSGKAIVSAQNPIYLDERSEPEPDILVLKKADDFYASGHPQPKDVYFLIEVADTTLESDRQIKLPLYAKAGIPEVWLINLKDREIEVHSRPESNVYTLRKIVLPGGKLSFPDLNLHIKPDSFLV